jgi:glutathione S-transferase
MPGDKEVRTWARASNAPVAIYDDEPPRTGWDQILALAERLGGPSLVPQDGEQRVRMFGLCHELLSEGGALWNGRLLAVHRGLASNGASGFPPPVAMYLGGKYGYAPDRVEPARRRLGEQLGLLRDVLMSGRRAGGPYYFGNRLTALDVYSAAAMNLFSPPPESWCKMLPMIRAGFESTRSEFEGGLAPELLAHRDYIYTHHLELPIEL